MFGFFVGAGAGTLISDYSKKTQKKLVMTFLENGQTLALWVYQVHAEKVVTSLVFKVETLGNGAPAL